MEQKMSLQSLPDTEVFSPCSLEHQDVYMYEDDHYIRGESDSPTYLDISASKSSNFPSIKQEPDQDTLMSWTQKHPEHWTQNEILDWIYFVAGTIDVDPTTIRGEGFQNISGPELCRMTEEDFLTRDPVNGKLFYDMFRMLFKDTAFIGPQGNDFNTPDQFQYPFKSEQPEVRNNCNLQDFKSKQNDRHSTYDKDMLVRNNEQEMQVLLGEYWYPIDPFGTDDVMEEISNHTWLSHSESGYSSSDGDSNSDAAELSILTGSRTLSTGSDLSLSDDDYHNTLIAPDDDSLRFKPQKSTNRRKKSSNGETDKTGSQNRGRKPGQISKGNHLWEFIRDLLKDPKFNPHLLRWEEKETGVFRFVQSEAVAQMWGRKKNNPGMTYEKLSRAMRFCRTAGYFAEVPKTGKFPKKLCFRFGAKAYGWED